MVSTLTNYWKAVGAFVGSVTGIWTVIAADEAISFDEIGYVKTAGLAAVAALVTALFPKNREV